MNVDIRVYLSEYVHVFVEVRQVPVGLQPDITRSVYLKMRRAIIDLKKIFLLDHY